MDPSTELLSTVLEPTSAVLPIEGKPAKETSWDLAYINPKNMVERLSPADNHDWVFFGGDMNGFRFFIVPHFAIGKPPRRIDVFVMDQVGASAAMCTVLGQHASIVTQGWKLRHQDFVLHLLHALQYWSDNTLPDFQQQYVNMPFGSRIIVKKICCDVAKCEIYMVRVDAVELSLSSHGDLTSKWSDSDTQKPQYIMLEELCLNSQSHEAISLVTIPSRRGEALFIFKSTTRDVSYLYHEIETLLKLPSHPNTVSKPTYIVVKACRFGGKLGVCGFIQEHHPCGNLRDALRLESPLFQLIDLETQYRWALELLSALRHIKSTAVGFYPDLKPDNILIKPTPRGLSTLLIDFEQRGAWCAWSPPEVYLVDYIGYIANSEVGIPEGTKRKYQQLLERYLAYRCPVFRIDRRHSSKNGLNMAWLTLSNQEKEFAMVYMFGKLIWCIFELQPTINCSLGAEIFREVNPDHRFPKFRRTPKALQSLITECTRGSKEWTARRTPLVRIGDQLFPYDKTGLCANEGASTFDVQYRAQQWWKTEIAEAESFMEQRMSEYGDCSVMMDACRRPRMDKILEMLHESGRTHKL